MDVYSGTGRTSADDVMVMPASAPARIEIQSSSLPLVEGDQVRDWSLSTPDAIFIPYNSDRLLALTELASAARWLWPHRTPLGNRMHFGSFTYFEEGRAWWSWHQINPSRLNYNFAISFAEIATHNHFVLARGGKVFKQTASVIRLPAQSSEDDHLGLLGLLNSSVACFWLKQVCHNKGGQGINEGLKAEAWERFYAYNATKVAKFSLPPGRALALAQRLEQLTQAIARLAPAALLSAVPPPDRAALDAAREQTTRLRRQMISSQEELDWQCYRLYGLLPEGSIPGNHESPAAPELQLGERAFEIVLARRVAAGDESTVWFARHGSTPISERTYSRGTP